MDPERWQKVQDLLAESLERPEEERLPFVRERCGDDEELRQEVESLLRASEHADDYFDALGDRAGIPRESTSDRLRALHEEEGTSDPMLASGGSGSGEGASGGRSLIGQSISHFRVIDFLGQGGMGKVYRATDTQLNRDVALKVLADRLIGSPHQAARLKREAQVLASLNHPNIGAIYGLEDFDGHQALVLELIEGQTLSERMRSTRRGRLSLDEALDVGRQIAEALEAAHGMGVMHRDLKPANIKLTPNGTVKVLDFGIAKALDPEGDIEGEPDWSPTEIMAATAPGRILGTVAYMSPEQARGKPIDGRTDIWAFGCVLFEALTGTKAFEGETATDTIAAIIERDPEWNDLPSEVPAEIQLLLRRCLRKDPRRRLRHIGDAWVEIDEAINAPGRAISAILAAAQPAVQVPLWRRALPWVAAGIVGALGIFLGSNLGRNPEPPTRRLEIALPGPDLRSTLGGRLLALSPDGMRLAHVSPTQLLLRDLDSFESIPIADILGAESPFFSPDNEWVGFFARGNVWKVSIRGGTPFNLCDATTPRGAAWGTDNTIVFSDGTSLWTTDGDGRECTKLADPRPGTDEVRYVWPTWLPGDEHVLFELVGEGWSRLAVLSRTDGSMTPVAEGGTDPHYISTGHIIYARAGTLFAVPFDTGSLTTTGTARPVLDRVHSESTGGTHASFSADGSLAYVPSTLPDLHLAWVDRNGNEMPVTEKHGDYTTPRLSPDGSQVAMVVGRSGESQVWIHDVEQDTQRQLTFEGTNLWPDWSSDGRRVAFISGRDGPTTVWWKPASGAGEAERLTEADGVHYVVSTARQRPVLAFFQVGADRSRDIWVLPLEGDTEPIPLITGPAHEQGPALSPDGRWVAYVSNESGRNEVYVQACEPCVGEPLPASGDIVRRQVSTDGGGEPVWSADGKELFYREGSKMMDAAIVTEPGLNSSRPQLLFEGPYVLGQSGNRNYDVSPNGQRFLMLKSSDPDPDRPRIHVVLNWFRELESSESR